MLQKITSDWKSEERREVYLDEVKDFAECGLCGTAAVISPVGKIVDHGKEICFPSGMEEMGPITKKLYETLDRYPDGTHRSSGRMDQSYRIIYDAGPKDLNPYELTHKFKTRCRTFSCALFFCLYFCIIRIVYRRMAWIKNLMTTDRISAL